MSISGLSKHKICFDPAKPSKGDNIGSYVRAGTDGDLISSTNVGGKEGLDVNILNALGVDIDGVYNGVSNTDPDNVGAIFHERAATPADANQTFRSTGASPDSDNVDPANVHAIDVNSFMMAWDGAAWDRVQIGADGLEVHVNQAAADCWEVEGCEADDAVDAGNPLKIGYRALSTLTAVGAGDRADAVSDLYRRLYINQSANIAGANGAVSIDDTAGGTAVVASPSASRKHLMVQNLGDDNVYLGFGTVTAANGILLPSCAIAQFDIGSNLDLKAIAETGETEDVRYMELG